MLYSIYGFNPEVNQTGTRVKVTPCPCPQSCRSVTTNEFSISSTTAHEETDTGWGGGGKGTRAADLQTIQNKGTMKLPQQMPTKAIKYMFESSRHF